MIEDLDSPMSGLTRGKLDSTSRESRASDSGISAEFSCDSNNLPLSTTQNGVSVSNVNTVTSNNTHCSDRLPSGGSASDTSIGDIHINGAHGKSANLKPNKGFTHWAVWQCLVKCGCCQRSG